MSLSAHERRVVAFHEAGHAIVALRLGCHVSEVIIAPTGDGECTHHPPRNARSWHAATALAGCLATRLYCRDIPGVEAWWGWDHCCDDRRQFDARRGGMSFRAGKRLALSILREEKDDLLEFVSILERDGYLRFDNAPERFKAM